MHASSCPGSQRDPFGKLLGTNDVLLAGAQKACAATASRTRAERCKFVKRARFGTPGAAMLATMFVVMAAEARCANAQSASGNQSLEGTQSYIDAILGTPNYKAPVSPDNILATAPGVEQPAPRPQFTLNILAPVFFNSNAQFLPSGGSRTLQVSPIVRLGWASQVFDTPLRISAWAQTEFERYPQANDAEIDYFRSSVRVQYVNPGNDQGSSPFISYVPRLDFETTFAREFATRQDLNVGFNKVFNFDGRFRRMPFSSDSSASSVFSLGFSAGLQWRFRSPAPESGAVFLNPSASYIISEDWNASFSMPTTRRWFVSVNGVAPRDWTIEPNAVLEYIIPANWLGGTDNARLLGWPAVDALVLFERNWSSEGSLYYSQWLAGLVLRGGWSVAFP
jgi:hypothetical protein